MRAPVLLLVLLALLVAVPAAAAQQRGAPKEVRYLATFELQGTSTWDRPAHNHLTDCAKRHFTSGRGEEKLSLRTRRPIPVLVRRGAGGVIVTVGTLDATRPPVSSGFRLAGPWSRERTDRRWWEPGTCGGGSSGDEPAPEDDCGTRLPSWLVHVQFKPDGRVYPIVGADPSVEDRSQEDFDRCPAEYANDLSIEASSLRGQKVTFGFGRPRSITVGERRSEAEQAPQGARPFSVKTTLRWTLTLQPVDRDGDPLPTRGKRRRGRG